MNQQIRAREIRVIDADGAQLGVMTPQDAQRVADQKELDLVEVAPTANPPVCRIMDYGKFRYAQKKKAQESRKKGAASQLKEVKMGSQTSAARRGLQGEPHPRVPRRRASREGDRVLPRPPDHAPGARSRHAEQGRRMVTDVATVEQSARLEGRHMSMMLVGK